MTIREIAEASTKKSSENDAGGSNLMTTFFFRPVSYVVTKPLLRTGLSPNQVSFISLVFAVVGFVLFVAGIAFPMRSIWEILGLVCFVLWNILDCVDGNIARIKKQFSGKGDLWDAAAGYAAMCLMVFSMGVAAFDPAQPYSVIYVILGGLSGLSCLYPRLLMHFFYHGEDNEINDKTSYGRMKLIAFNITSPDCFVQPIMLISILLGLEGAYTIAYFVMYAAIMLYSSARLLRG